MLYDAYFLYYLMSRSTQLAWDDNSKYACYMMQEGNTAVTAAIRYAIPALEVVDSLSAPPSLESSYFENMAGLLSTSSRSEPRVYNLD